MGYGWDEEDVGGILAEQDSYEEECEELDGECRYCPHKYTCWSSYYRTGRMT